MIIVEKRLHKSLDQRFQSEGRLETGEEATSDAKRWVILWTVQVLKTRSIVCLSARPESILFESDTAAVMRSVWKDLQKASLPIGTPRMRRPFTSSCIDPSLFRE